MTEKQKELMRSLGLATEFGSVNDEQLIMIENKLSDEIQFRGINVSGDGLNEYGELCLAIIKSLPD